MINNDKVLTLKEVAQLLKISTPTVYRKVQSGELPAKKIGRGWRFLAGDIMALMKAGKGESPVSNISSAPIDTEKIVELCKKHGIGLCYVFGSFAEGTADSLSDVDIGVVFLPHVDLTRTLSLYEIVKNDFSGAVKNAELDLIFLQKVGPLVRDEAIKGTCIYSVSDFFRSRYEDSVMSEAMDFKFFRKKFDQEMIEEIKEGGFIAA